MSYPKKENLIRIYRKRAQNYDITANLHHLLGYPEQRYRRRAVKALRLKSGDAVVEPGCGTGLNFPMLHESAGREGRIILRGGDVSWPPHSTACGAKPVRCRARLPDRRRGAIFEDKSILLVQPGSTAPGLALTLERRIALSGRHLGYSASSLDRNSRRRSS